MNVLIVKLSSIGDVVHALPAAAYLRRRLPPEATISWAVERRAAGILRGSPVLDRLIELDTRTWRGSLLSRATFRDAGSRVRELTRNGERAHVALDLQGLMKSGVVTALSGAIRRIGFETAELREPASRVFLTEQVATSRYEHVIEKNLAIARAVLGDVGAGEDVPYEFPISVSLEDEKYVEAAIGDRDFAILNPGGGWPTKLWPPERFGELGDWLWSEMGLRSVVTWGPGEEELARTVVNSAGSNEVRSLASTLKQFVVLARRAKLIVGGDTGPMHIAAACATPIVGLYGPTSPARNGPFNPLDEAVGLQLWCRNGCHRRSCWHWECMNIPVDAVKDAVTRRLRQQVELCASTAPMPANAIIER